MTKIRITSSLLIVAFILVATGCGDRRFDGNDGSGDAANLTTNIIALHDSSSPQYRDDCLSCHSEILTQESLDPAVPMAHKVMLPEVPGKTTQEKCVHCHTTVDILQHSAGNIRRNVAVQTCAVCHGPSGPSVKQYYQK